MQKIVLLVLLFIVLKGNAQTDGTKLNRKELIRLDSIGLKFHNLQKYTEAINYFNQALQIDSTFGQAILHRAISIASSGSKSDTGINICNEFQRAYDYGAKHVEEPAFFYGCKIKKRK